jgi:hypothetical protein
MHLMACDFHKSIQGVYQRTPVLRPHGNEHVFLDPAQIDQWEQGLPVPPPQSHVAEEAIL